MNTAGTGFSRIMGKDKEKAFWGQSRSAHAFDRFIRRFLTKYDRWNELNSADADDGSGNGSTGLCCCGIG